MRGQPRIAIDEIVAGARLQPSGAHELVVDARSNVVGVRYSLDQVDQLERAIRRFREVVAFEDGRTTEIHNPRFIPLEVR